MEKKLILRGVLAGAIAGLLAFVFARIFAEPVINQAINYESGRDAVIAALDKAAGQTNGEGSSNFGAKWYAVSARGTAVLRAPTTSTTSPTTCAYPPCP